MAATEGYYKGKYSDLYGELHNETNEIYEDILTNPASKFWDEIEIIKGQVDNLVMNPDAWDDNAKTSFISIQSEVSADLSSLVENARNFGNYQNIYKLLKEQLDALQKEDSVYENHLASKPSPEYEKDEDGNPTKNLTSSYKSALSLWETTKEEIEEVCQDMCDTVEELKTILDEIENLGYGETPASFNGTYPIVVEFFDFGIEITENPQLGSPVFSVGGFDFYEISPLDDRNVPPGFKTTINIGGIEKDVYITGDLADSLKEHPDGEGIEDYDFVETYMEGLRDLNAEGNHSELLSNIDYIYFKTDNYVNPNGVRVRENNVLYMWKDRIGNQVGSGDDVDYYRNIKDQDNITPSVIVTQGLVHASLCHSDLKDDSRLWSEYEEAFKSIGQEPKRNIELTLAACDANAQELKDKAPALYEYYTEWWPKITGLDPK